MSITDTLSDAPDLVWRFAGALRVVLRPPVKVPQQRLGPLLSPVGAADGLPAQLVEVDESSAGVGPRGVLAVHQRHDQFGVSDADADKIGCFASTVVIDKERQTRRCSAGTST